MRKSIKIRIYPNKNQISFIEKSFGCNRLVYNYYLNKRKEEWEKNKVKISAYDCINDLVNLKQKPEYSFLNEVDSQSLIQTLLNLDKAYKRFFRTKKGYPKFKSKYDSSKSYTSVTNLSIKGSKLKIPKISGIRYKDTRTVEGSISRCTISKQGDKYFASLLLKEEFKLPETKTTSNNIIGLDLGIKNIAVLSNGKKYESNTSLNKGLKKLKRLSRSVSRKVKGSKNRNKAKIKLANHHLKIANTRRYYNQHLAHQLLSENQAVNCFVIEKLNLNSLKRNRSLSRSFNDVSIGQLVDCLKYACSKKGIRVEEVNPAYTSKQCSNCKCINNELTLNDRAWVCSNCNTPLDRDINAAINIREKYLITEPRETRGLPVELAPLGVTEKQEYLHDGRLVPTCI